MPCSIKLQVHSFINGHEETGATTLIKEVAPEQKVTMDDIVKQVIGLTKTQREKLAQRLRSAKTQTLSTSDIKKYRFISNTSIDEILDHFPQFKEVYKDLKVNPEDNYTIITCNSMTLNGKTLSGRMIDPDGNELFIITSEYGAEAFLKYLDSKSKIRKAFSEGNTLIDQFKHLQESLDSLIEKYKQSGQSLLKNFLNNRGSFKPADAQILNKLLNTITGTISNSNKSEFYQLLYDQSERSKSGNSYIWNITTSKLYNVLQTQFPDMTLSREEFNNLSNEELTSFLLNAFAGTQDLIRARIKNITSGKTTESIIPGQQKIAKASSVNAIWQQIKKQNPNLKLKSIETELEKDPQNVITIFEQALQGAFTEDGVTYPAIVRIGTNKSGEKKIEISYITNDKVSNKINNRIVTINFPWTSLGESYNFSYDTEYLWVPVRKYDPETGQGDKDLDQDGMYHGAYIYEYYDPRTKGPKYAVSRHIISPNTTDHSYISIDQAKEKIDSWNNSQIIKLNSLSILKQQQGTPRETYLNITDIREGQIITTLDVKLPYYREFPKYLQDLRDSTVPNFQKFFSMVPNIKELNTPEKADVFIHQFYQLLRGAAPSKNSSYLDIINEHISEAQQLVSSISNLGTKSFMIEQMVKTKNMWLGTLRYLENNGVKIDLTGKFGKENANKPSMDTMEQAAKYFNDQFGLNISVLSKDEFDDFDKKNSLELNSDTRAFVFNGNIYLNGSKADISDMFHEMSHIFLGLIKAQSRDAYNILVSKFQEQDPVKFNKTLGYIKQKYSKFSNEDKLEETLVHMLAQKMFTNKSLSETFNGDSVIKEFDVLFDLVKTNYPQLLESQDTSSLDFKGLISALKTDANISTMNRNMKMSQLIKSYIDQKLIKETGC